MTDQFVSCLEDCKTCCAKVDLYAEADEDWAVPAVWPGVVFIARRFGGDDRTYLTAHYLDCTMMRAAILGDHRGPLVEPYRMPWGPPAPALTH